MFAVIAVIAELSLLRCCRCRLLHCLLDVFHVKIYSRFVSQDEWRCRRQRKIISPCDTFGCNIEINSLNAETKQPSRRTSATHCLALEVKCRLLSSVKNKVKDLIFWPKFNISQTKEKLKCYHQLINSAFWVPSQEASRRCWEATNCEYRQKKRKIII